MNPRTCNCRVLHLCLACLGMLLAAATPVRAQAPDDRLERVLAAWQQRQHAFKAIRYTVKGTNVRPKGSFIDSVTGRSPPQPTPPEDVTEPQDFNLLLDFADKRFRLEVTQQVFLFGARKLGPQASTTVFDGKDSFTLRPRSANSNESIPWNGFDVLIGRNVNAVPGTLAGTITAQLGPLLYAHGLVPRLTRQPDFEMELAAKDFSIHGQGVQDGRPCVVVRSIPHETFLETTIDEYWVDPERDGAILRHTAYSNENPIVDREVAWQATAHGWLPLRWTETYRTGPGRKRIDSVTRLEVVDFEADPAVTAADFRVAIEPGMDVAEATVTKAGQQKKTFRVRADGGWNEVVNGVEQPGRSWAPYYWGGALAAVVLGLALWHLRRKARRHTPPPTSGTPGLQML